MSQNLANQQNTTTSYTPEGSELLQLLVREEVRNDHYMARVENAMYTKDLLLEALNAISKEEYIPTKEEELDMIDSLLNSDEVEFTEEDEERLVRMEIERLIREND